MNHASDLTGLKACLASALIISLTALNLFSQDLRSELERIIINDTDISYDLTPGFIIGIIDGDSTYIESFGTHADDRHLTLTQNDIFELGSVTKVFTSSVIDISFEKGMISLDEKVNDFLPLEYRNPRMTDLTIKDLVNHSSGLPKRPYGFGEKELDPQNPYALFSKTDLLESFSIFVPETDAFVYSHMNYALLEIILEQIYQMPFEEILHTVLFEPLGMERTFIHFLEDKNVLAAGRDRSGTLVGPWIFPSFAASEGAKSNLGDLLMFLRANLGLYVSSTTRSFLNNFDEAFTSFNEHITVSTGWQMFKVSKKLSIALHTGTTSGHSAFVGMVRETGTGVVVLSNSAFGTRDLGMLVLRMINHNWKRKPNGS